MLYLVHGPDSYSRHEFIAGVRAKHDIDGMLATNSTPLDGRRVAFEELAAVCSALPFLGAFRWVKLSGLLARADGEKPGGRRRSTAKRAATPPAEDDGGWLRLITLAETMPDTTILVLEEGELKANNPVLEALTGLARIRSGAIRIQAFPRMSVQMLEGWIAERARQQGTVFEGGCHRLLAASVPIDVAEDGEWHTLWTVVAEMEKLRLYAGARITESDIRRLVPGTLESRVWVLTDAVADRDGPKAMAALEELLASGRPAPVLLAAIAGRYRQLIGMRELLEARTPAREAGERLAVRNQYQLDRLRRQAERATLPRLEAAYERIVDTDRAIKTGKMADTLALELLVAGLSGA